MTLLYETAAKKVPHGPRAASAISSTHHIEDGSRLASIDLLRGLVMVLMALDHTRDFFAAGGFNPRDVADPALFLTRWVTHFCAPVFVFLAGISAFLYGAQKRRTNDVSWFLLTRGLWLVFIEFTVVRLGWTFSFDASYFLLQVIFVLGVSMIALAGLVYLPRWAIATIGVAMILSHNALDGIKAVQFGTWAPLWHILHEPEILKSASGVKVFALYPLIPWIGVMATGYALGPVFLRGRADRARRLLTLGAAITIGFVLLRATNAYGNPSGWVAHEGMVATALSFIDCDKYPPSLLYLAMTLGPAIMLLAGMEFVRGRLADAFATFGQVPFFYYVAHIFLIHALAIAFAWATGADMSWLFGEFPAPKPEGYGLGLPGVYAATLLVVGMLYPLCRWFAAVKRRRRDWWLSYL